ncbi:TPA: SpaA isopeptide-forming pilin-related protein [Enterococcus faecalis]
MLLGQNITGITAFAEGITDNPNIETEDIYFENSEGPLTNVEMAPGEENTLTLVDTSKEDQEVTVTLPSSVTLNNSITNTQLNGGNTISFDQQNNQVKVTFADENQAVKKVALSLIAGNEEAKGNQSIVAKTVRQDGLIYSSKPLPVTILSNGAEKATSSENSVVKESNAPNESTSKENETKMVRAGNTNVDLDISAATASVYAGRDAVFTLNFKVTGSQTIYHNAKIMVSIPEGFELNQELTDLQIAGVTPVLEANQLVYQFSQIESGQTYTKNLKIKTINGTTPNGTKVTLTSDFIADEFTGNAHSEATSTIQSASLLAISKGYRKTIDGLSGSDKKDPPISGDIGVWSIKVVANKKDEGVMYFKEGSKIKVVDTIPEGLIYDSDDANGIYDSAAKTVTWEFDAPTIAEQNTAKDVLFEKNINVNLKFDTNITNYQKITNEAKAEGTNVADEVISKNKSATVVTGEIDPDIPSPSGASWILSHNGTKDAYGKSGINQEENQIFYDWAELKFNIGIRAGNVNSPTKDFEKYEVTYNIDDHLNLNYIKKSGYIFSPYAGFPNGIYPDNKTPLFDIFLTIDGVDKKFYSNTENKDEILNLADYGIKKGTHVSKVRINYTYAPAGMYSNGFSFDFGVEKGYVGEVANTVHYDIQGYNANGNPAVYDNSSIMDNVNTSTGVRSAEIIPTPSGAVPIAHSEIRFDTSSGGIVKPGNNRITGRFTTEKNSIAAMQEPFSAMVLLPVGVKVDKENPQYKLNNTTGWDEGTTDGNNRNGTLTVVTDDYKNTNRQLVKVNWKTDNMAVPNVKPNQQLSYGFNTIIDKNAPTPLRMDTYGYSGDKKLKVADGRGLITDSYLETNADNLDGSGDVEKLRVQSANQYHMTNENQIQTQKLVKGEKDTTYSKFGHTLLGGQIDYRVSMKNTGNDIVNFTMMDVLSSKGDLGITDNTARGSQFTPELTGPITLPAAWKDKVTIQYSEATNPSRKDLDKNVNYPATTTHLVDPTDAQVPDWKTESQVTDWSKIHSFIITLTNGEWTKGDEVTLDFSMKAPEKLSSTLTDPDGEEEARAAWNSFAYTANNSQVVEPERVGVVVDYVGSVVLTKVDDKTGETLKDAEFELQDKDGTKVQEGLVTDGKGQIKVENLAPGEYQFVETKAPADYQLNQTPVPFTVDRGQTKAVEVTMKNKKIISPTAPDIHKDVEGKQHVNLSDRNQAFNWHVVVSFGNNTVGWNHVSVVDPVNPLFSINNVKVMDETGADVTGNGTLSIDNNKVTFTVNKKDGSYDYLSGHTYTLTINTSIRKETTNEQLAPYLKEGGIPNQADLTVANDSDSIHSEIPKVTPPDFGHTDSNTPSSTADDPIVNGNQSKTDKTVSPKKFKETPSKEKHSSAFLPSTGEKSTLSLLLMRIGLVVVIGIVWYVLSKHRHSNH